MNTAARHPPSAQLQRFCLAVLRLRRGPSADGGTLATIAGISRFYSVRWQQGQMYMDRAEQLVRLAGALEVDIKILIDIACGTLTAEQALGIHSGARGQPETAVQRLVDTSLLDAAAELGASPGAAGGKARRRRLVLVISPSADHRSSLLAALQQVENVAGMIAETLSLGLVVAERYRPHIVFLDLAASPHLAFEACRALARLTCGPDQRTRVLLGTPIVNDAALTTASLCGALAVYPLPFAESAFLAEINRAAGSSKATKPATRGQVGGRHATAEAPRTQTDNGVSQGNEPSSGSSQRNLANEARNVRQAVLQSKG